MARNLYCPTSWKEQLHVLWFFVFDNPPPRIMVFFLRTWTNPLSLRNEDWNFTPFVLTYLLKKVHVFSPVIKKMRNEINKEYNPVSVEGISFLEPLITHWMFTPCTPLWHCIVLGNTRCNLIWQSSILDLL